MWRGRLAGDLDVWFLLENLLMYLDGVHGFFVPRVLLHLACLSFGISVFPVIISRLLGWDLDGI